MRKLSNNDPGFLKQKFEKESSFASLKTWKALEEELVALNHQRRRRKLIFFAFSLSAASVALLLLALNIFQSTSNTNYEVRNTVDSQGLINDHEDIQLAFASPHFEESNFMHKVSLPTTSLDTALFSKSVVPEAQLDHNRAPIAQIQKLNKVAIIATEIPVLPGDLMTESIDFDIQFAKPKSAKWRLTLQGGLDDSRQVLAAKNAVIGDPSAGNSSRSWDFNNYTYQRPIALNLSIERRVWNRLYIRAGWDYKHMRSIALAEPFKNQTAIKRGYLDHVGLNMGASYTLIDHKRLSLDLIGEVSLAHVKNSYTQVEEFNNGEFVRSYEIERTTPSSILSLGAQARLNYRIAGRWNISAAMVSLKPIHNYIDELNVYNNGFKYIHGARIGISFEL